MSLEVAAVGAVGFLTIYGPYIAFLIIAGVFIAYKLRLMKKFGFYLGGMGFCFLVAGVLSLGNPGLLLIGNLLILAGISIFISATTFNQTPVHVNINKLDKTIALIFRELFDRCLWSRKIPSKNKPYQRLLWAVAKTFI